LPYVLEVFGFTLIELMVVIAIAGIFMSVALPDFSKMVESYRLKEAVESLKSENYSYL
jgi:prepilin-type N-terminal cleavage/methylation domain-containing protein